MLSIIPMQRLISRPVSRLETVTIHIFISPLQFESRPHLFEEFLVQNPHLMDAQLLSRHYSAGRIWSQQARERWVGHSYRHTHTHRYIRTPIFSLSFFFTVGLIQTWNRCHSNQSPFDMSAVRNINMKIILNDRSEEETCENVIR